MRSKRRRILIDVCHPAEVHHFKYVYWELSKKGWTFLFAAKDKDVTAALLKAYDLPHVLFSKSKRGLIRKLLYVPHDLWSFFQITRRFRPTLLLSNLSLHASWVAAIYRLTHIACIDTEHRRLLDYVTLPFAHIKLTPQAYSRHLGRNHFRYHGNHELAYVHPKRFAPQADIKTMLGLKSHEKYVLLRFVAWQAFHDVGLHGMPVELKKLLIREIEKNRRVFISSESELPADLTYYQLNVPPERIHDVLYYADAYIGEGGTMASEAVCLGTPAVYVNALRLGYCVEEAQARLLLYVPELTLNDVPTIARIGKTAAFQKKHKQFIKKHVDVTAYVVRFIERFPQSLQE
ncbi:DUF354 domain-containing protein [candidate division KSB1 bacterium]|nr:DUF354 domain-containing protein [candidate division KSB1 bacterium]